MSWISVAPWLFWLFQATFAAKDVLIVGGGMSGVSAARRLMNDGGGRYNVTILEGRANRYGGRIWTNKVGLPWAQGAEVELGGSWIHASHDRHPITQLQQKFNLKTFDTGSSLFAHNGTFGWNTTSNKVVTNKELEAAKVLFQYAYFIAAMNAVEENAPRDISLREALRTQGLTSLFKDPLFLHLTAMGVESYIGSSVDRISAKMYKLNEEISMEGETETKTKENVLLAGYSELLRRMVDGYGEEEPLNLHLDKKVTNIIVDKKNKRAKVITSDGTTYEADSVIVTPSLGVLKSGMITFSPPLPAYKQEAIDKVGYGNVNKVVMEFDHLFWPEHVLWIFMTPSPEDEESRGMLTGWMSYYPITKRPVMTGWLTGYSAYISEHLSDEQLKNRALEALQMVFGSKHVNEKTLVGFVRSRWHTDEFAQGTYSFSQVGTRAEHWDALKADVKPCLHFAGEHTNYKNHGTVLAAYMSGQRAAEEVMTTDTSSSISGSSILRSSMSWLLIFCLLTICVK